MGGEIGLGRRHGRLKETYPEMAHTYAVILLFFSTLNFKHVFKIYSKNQFDYNMHFSIKHPLTKIKTFKLISIHVISKIYS